MQTEQAFRIHNLAKDFRSIRTSNAWRVTYDNWGAYGSGLKQYDESFRSVLPAGIANFLSPRRTPTIIDLMAPTRTLSEIFKKLKQRNKFGIAVSLADVRGHNLRKADDKSGIQLVSGDITMSSTWRKIRYVLNERKADLVIERGLDGLNCLPVNELFYWMILNNAWRLLSENQGVLLLQTPSEEALKENEIHIREWIERLSSNSIDVLYVPYAANNGKGAIKITKNPHSPPRLPEV